MRRVILQEFVTLELGSGRPLFGDKVAPRDMKLLGAKAMDRGTVSLKYAQRTTAV